jgi:putative methyltransferase (TIGR04325 family)
MSTAGAVRGLLPSALLPYARRLSPSRMRFARCHGDWAAARAASGGYDTAGILERVAAATREVAAGPALWERDSMLFHHAEYVHPVVGALMRTAARHGGELEVVDFGGALGSLYWQHRRLLEGLPRVRWQVIEQPAFVELGRREFANGTLRFATDLGSLETPRVPPVFLAGSVLQYLEHPDAMLAEWLAFPSSCLVLDRMPMTAHGEHQLYVQHVPAYLYAASYPCWLLSASRLRAALAGTSMLYEYDSPGGEFMAEDWQRYHCGGFVCEPRSP